MTSEAKPSNPPPGEFGNFGFPPGRVFALGMNYADHSRETCEKPVAPEKQSGRGSDSWRNVKNHSELRGNHP